jgi:hypothetical protein
MGQPRFIFLHGGRDHFAQRYEAQEGAQAAPFVFLRAFVIQALALPY